MDQTKRNATVNVLKTFTRRRPNNSAEVTEIDEFINKVRQTIDTAIFTINMEEKPLSEIVDILEMFVSKIEVPKAIRNETVSLNVNKKTMKEVLLDLALEMS